MKVSLIQILKHIAIRYLDKNYIIDGFDDWKSARLASEGYDSPEIAKKIDQAASIVKQNSDLYERDGVIFKDFQVNWPLIAGIFLAKENGKRLNILDFGGSLGTSFFQHRRILGIMPNFSWDIVEQGEIYNIGVTKFRQSNLNFHENIDNYLAEKKPNIAILGGSLQYMEDYISILDKISESGAKVLIIDRIPLSRLKEDVIAVQRVPKNIYNGSYPIRIFSLEKITKILEVKWRILSIFETIGSQTYTKNRVMVEWKGIFCFRK